MGWASGSRLFGDIIDVLQVTVGDEDQRKEIYLKLIESFEDQDWDTQDECLDVDPAYDEALRELHPDWFEDEEDED